MLYTADGPDRENESHAKAERSEPSGTTPHDGLLSGRSQLPGFTPGNRVEPGLLRSPPDSILFIQYRAGILSPYS